MSLRGQPGNRGPSVWSGQVSFRLDDDKATRVNLNASTSPPGLISKKMCLDDLITFRDVLWLRALSQNALGLSC